MESCCEAERRSDQDNHEELSSLESVADCSEDRKLTAPTVKAIVGEHGGGKDVAGLNSGGKTLHPMAPASDSEVTSGENARGALRSSAAAKGKGHSASETAVVFSPAENMTRIFTADITSTASFTPTTRDASKALERRSSLLKDEIMPKTLTLRKKQQQEKDGNLKNSRLERALENKEASMGAGWRSHNLAVILEVDEDKEHY